MQPIWVLLCFLAFNFNVLVGAQSEVLAVKILSRDCINALESGNAQIVEMLLNDDNHREMVVSGVDPDEDGETALMKAVARDHSHVVALLIRHGADPDAHDANFRTAAMVGSSLAREKGLLQLLQHPKYAINRIGSALAVSNSSFSSIDLDIESPSIDLRDKFGRSAFLWACYAGNLNEAKILLDYGSNVDLGDNDMRTPLMWAATSSRGLPVVKLLLERGADVTLQDKFGSTALHWAIEGGKKDAAELIAHRLYEPKYQPSEQKNLQVLP